MNAEMSGHGTAGRSPRGVGYLGVAPTSSGDLPRV